MSDLISRQEALIAIMDLYPGMPRVPWLRKRWARRYEPYIDAEKAIRRLPSAEPEHNCEGCRFTFYAKADEMEDDLK